MNHRPIFPKRVAPLIATVAGILAGTATAQSPVRDADPSNDNRPNQQAAAAMSYKNYLQTKQARVSELIGKTISTPDGDDVGEIHDVLIDTERPMTPTVVLSVGGLLDGDKLVAASLDEILVSRSGDELYIDSTAAQLEAEPSFAYQPQSASDAARSSTSKNLTSMAGLIGAPLKDGTGEEIGSVDDVVLSSGGTSTRAVVSVGGLAGIGDRLVAIPLRELAIDAGSRTAAANESEVTIDAGEEALEQLPEFEYSESGV
jgi:sporulation protein YlmC with PRC-barrel domain